MIEKIPHTIGNQIFPLKCGFGIGYGIGRNYQPIWVSVSVLDRNQNSGYGCTLTMFLKKTIGGNIIGQFDSDDMDILDTTTNTWSKGPSMAKRRATQDCIVTEHNGEKGVMVMLKFL